MVDLDERRELAFANSASDVQAWLISRISKRHPSVGIHCMVFGPTATSTPQSMVYLGEEDAAPFQDKIQPAVGALLQHHELPGVFSEPDRRLRVEDHLGWRAWLKSPVYQEHFRPMRSARQLVLGMATTAGAPLGFISIAQAEDSERITLEEEHKTMVLRDLAAKSLEDLAIIRDGTSAFQDVLLDITMTLPFAAFLVDEGGTVLWMNREAELRLSIVALTFGSRRILGGVGMHALRELGSLVQRELRQPGSARLASLPWMASGESLLVRRVEGETQPERALACIVGQSPATPAPASRPTPESLRQRYRLSAREAEVALLASEGYTVLNISCQLNIAESTVATLLKRTYKKMEIRSRAELAWKIGHA